MTREEEDKEDADKAWSNLELPNDEIDRHLKKIFIVGFVSGRRTLRKKIKADPSIGKLDIAKQRIKTLEEGIEKIQRNEKLSYVGEVLLKNLIKLIPKKEDSK